MSSIQPFANESDALQLGELHIENRIDRVSLFGILDITKDKAGLQNARELKALFDATVQALESKDLPDNITLATTDTVKNPFQE